MTDAQWYYAENGEQQGPVSLAELRRLVAAKRVQADDLVWCEGMDDWLPSADVAELQAHKPKVARKVEASPAKVAESKPVATSAKTASKSAATAESNTSTRTPAKTAKPSPESTNSAADKFSLPDPVADRKEESFPGFGTSEAEEEPAAEESSDDLDEAEAALFARPKFPTKRPSPPPGFQRESRREMEREPEIIREVTREVVVATNADAQQSVASLFIQLICWAMCGLAVCAAAIMSALRWFSAEGVESYSTMLISVAIGSYVLSRAAQRCLEILAAIKHL